MAKPQTFLGKTKSTVKVGSCSTVKPPSRRSDNRTLFCQKSTRSSFRGGGACEKVLLEGHPNRILGFSEKSQSRAVPLYCWFGRLFLRMAQKEAHRFSQLISKPYSETP